MTKPVFQHDTDSHMFAGTIESEHGTVDVWYGHAHDELVIRHGNEGHEYRCVPVTMASMISATYAKAAGMIKAKLDELAHSLVAH